MHKHGGDIYTHKNVLDFSANINFRGMPESVRQAARSAVDDCVNYPDPEYRKLKAAIAEREQVLPEQVVCGNGAADLIFSLVLAYKPERALLPAPTFYEYEQALLSVGCEIERYYLRQECGFSVQEDFVERITGNTDMIFLCNPNNPTGILISQDLLKRILRRCETCGAVLVLDECFNDFLEEPEKHTMKSYIAESENLFILKAFTKMYAMAGLRLGYGLCGNGGIMEQMRQNRQPWSVSTPAQEAGLAAAAETEFAKESRQAIQKEREYLTAELRNMGYRTLDSQANYIFLQGPADLYDRCLEMGILIRDCSNYEGLSGGWFRVAVKSRRDNLRLAEVLRKVWKQSPIEY